MAKFYGVYRGVVAATNDPNGMGRIKLRVPQVLGKELSAWAWNISPSNAEFEVPAVGQGVWIAFENGETSAPIWWGGFGTPKTDNYYAFIKLLEAGSYPDSVQLRQKNSGKYQLDIVETLVSLATKVETLEATAATLQGDVTDLQTAVAALETLVTDLEARVAVLEGA